MHLFCLLAILGVLYCLPSQACAQLNSLNEVREILQQCQDASRRMVDYRGVLRHEVNSGGGELSEDSIEVIFRKPSFLSLKWQTGLFKGTTLLARPFWNRGNLLIQLGEWFDFLTLNMPPTEVGEPFVPSLKDLSEWFAALTALAHRSLADRSLRQLELRTSDPSLTEGRVLLSVPAFLIPFRDNAVATYDFIIERGTGIPMELILRGVAGDMRQRFVYQDLQMNIGTPAQAFEQEEKAEGLRNLPREEVEIDVREFIKNWQQRYVEVSDYTGEWRLEERRGDGLLQSFSSFKFRKPFEVYLLWQSEKGNREALFRRGWNADRVRVRTSLSGIPLIGDLAPDGYLARWGYQHPLTEFGMNRLVEILQERLLREWLRESLVVRFRGLQDCAGRLCYAIEFNFVRSLDSDNSALRVVTYWDIAARLPVKYEEFDWAGLRERQEFRHVHINIPLKDEDFDAANPTYGFLLFPQAPKLDRFLTGRE